MILIYKIKKPLQKRLSNLLSRWQDSNLRPPAPKAGWINYLQCILYADKYFSSHLFKLGLIVRYHKKGIRQKIRVPR